MFLKIIAFQAFFPPISRLIIPQHAQPRPTSFIPPFHQKLQLL